MDDEQRRQMARNAMAVQNLQLKLVAGMVAGFIVGVLVAAYIILPREGPSTSWITLLAVFTPILGIFVGQRLVLSMLSR